MILEIYARRPAEGLTDECNRKGVYLTTEYEDLTPLKLE